MDTPVIPANVLSVILKASSILKPAEVNKKEWKTSAVAHSKGFLVIDNTFRGELVMLLTRCCVPVDVDQRASWNRTNALDNWKIRL